jgi:hypothetical protein
MNNKRRRRIVGTLWALAAASALASSSMASAAPANSGENRCILSGLASSQTCIIQDAWRTN